MEQNLYKVICHNKDRLCGHYQCFKTLEDATNYANLEFRDAENRDEKCDITVMKGDSKEVFSLYKF